VRAGSPHGGLRPCVDRPYTDASRYFVWLVHVRHVQLQYPRDVTAAQRARGLAAGRRPSLFDGPTNHPSKTKKAHTFFHGWAFMAFPFHLLRKIEKKKVLLRK
jgi:hypothetical protein